MKRFKISLLLCTISVALSACGGTDTKENKPEANPTSAEYTAEKEDKEASLDYEASMDGFGSTYNQSVVIAENSDMWLNAPEYANDIYQYAVTDLDHNGRLEIIVANCGGTGSYTYSHFYEVNDTYDDLAECETDFAEGVTSSRISSRIPWISIMKQERMSGI